jgi:hypothetical protein
MKAWRPTANSTWRTTARSRRSCSAWPSLPRTAEALDARVEENLDGRVEAEELREALERVQSLSLEVREELDAYQQRHAC